MSHPIIAYIHNYNYGLPSAMATGLFPLFLALFFALSRATQIQILNMCTYTVWAAAYPGGGRQLKQGETWTLSHVSGSGRIWGRTNCDFGHDGRGRCESGDCDGLLECQANGRAPNTVGVYSVNEGNNNNDIFYISVVEGFNVPMGVGPIGSSLEFLNCSQVRKCAADVNGACPMELRDVAGCNNPCTVFRNNQFCCMGSICEPTIYSRFFKDLCPEAFTYPSDVGQISSCPTGNDYRVVFCPAIDKPGTFLFLFTLSLCHTQLASNQ